MRTVGDVQREADIRMIERARKRDYVRDLRLACAALFECGATEEEVDDILTDRPVPLNPDTDWARAELSRLFRVRGGR